MHHLIQQVKAGIGFVVEDGNITLFAVRGEKYLPALRGLLDGEAIRTVVPSAEIVPLLGHLQVGEDGLKLLKIQAG